MMIEIFQVASSLALGLLMGSLLTEAMILVPYWRKMSSNEFLQLHHTLGPKLMQYFAPLTILGTVLPVAAAVVPLLCGQANLSTPTLSWVPAVLVVMMLILYFAYFKGANESFADGSVGVDGVAEELNKWASWHWVRVVLGIIAFFTSLLVLSGY